MAPEFAELKRRRGPIIAEISETYSPFEVTLEEMEMFAILRAIQLAVERGYRCVKVRSDYNQMRRSLKEDIKLGKIGTPETHRAKLLALAKTIEEIKISYYPRRKNHIAHRLARKGAGIFPKPNAPTTGCGNVRNSKPLITMN